MWRRRAIGRTTLTARASHTIEGARHAPVLPMLILSCATPAHHGPPDFICRGCDCCHAVWTHPLEWIRRFILWPGRHLLVGGVASVGSWRRETERFRRRGTRGPQEVAERPSQVPTEARCECIVHKPERARAEQREQQGRRSASRHGAKRGLVPAVYARLMPD